MPSTRPHSSGSSPTSEAATSVSASARSCRWRSRSGTSAWNACARRSVAPPSATTEPATNCATEASDIRSVVAPTTLIVPAMASGRSRLASSDEHVLGARAVRRLPHLPEHSVQLVGAGAREVLGEARAAGSGMRPSSESGPCPAVRSSSCAISSWSFAGSPNQTAATHPPPRHPTQSADRPALQRGSGRWWRPALLLAQSPRRSRSR